MPPATAPVKTTPAITLAVPVVNIPMVFVLYGCYCLLFYTLVVTTLRTFTFQLPTLFFATAAARV
jgi:hypothetical protein